MPFLILFSMVLNSPLQLIPTTSDQIEYMGRFKKVENIEKEFLCSFPGSSIFIRTNSPEVQLLIQDYPLDSLQPNYISIIVDGVETKSFALQKDKKEYSIYSNPDKEFHTIQVFKRTESLIGNIGFLGFGIAANAATEKVTLPTKKMLFIGNSITCGYGCEAEHETETFSAKTENAYMSFASISARELQSQYHLIAYSGKGIYRNWADTVFDVETMPFIFERTLAYDTKKTWNDEKYTPNIIVLNIGTNDFSPPLGPDKKLYIDRYSKFLQRITFLYPNATIICTNSQMLNDPQRTDQIEWLQEAMKLCKNERLYFCKLSMQGALGYGADWHPNIAQNKVNSKELVDFIKEMGL